MPSEYHPNDATSQCTNSLGRGGEIAVRTCIVVSFSMLMFGCSKHNHALSGTVEHDGKPIAGATVRVKGTTTFAKADHLGKFKLPLPTPDQSVVVTASADGFYIGGCDFDSKNTNGKIDLTPLPTHDNEDYEWVDPTPDSHSPDRCGNCHPGIFDQWSSGAHATSANGLHLLDLYAGTNQLASKPSSSDSKSWNMLRDRAEGIGVCTSCHAPSASIDELAIGDIRHVDGVAKQGVHCDFCHKVQSVSTKNVGITHGRFGMNLLRPEHGQLFFGPLDDVDRGEDVHGPHLSKSEYCAACHEGTLFGVHVYGTYTEWLRSPARREGKQCQDCHMKPDGVTTNFAPDNGGVERNPMTLASHQLFPGGKAAMLKGSLHVDVELRNVAEGQLASVTLTATKVGHRVPTGFVDRHLILVIEGLDTNGNSIPATSGPTLPDSCGSLARMPGKLFAKQLFGESGETPIPFWAEVFDEKDTRLIPHQPARTDVHFPMEIQSVRVRMIYRRFWESVEKEKGWPNGAIIVYDQVHPASSNSSAP